MKKTSIELLKKRKEQLRENLNKNSRVRAIILDSNYITDFDTKVVQLVEDFVNKYNSKIKLYHCPLFSLVSDEIVLNDVWKRLNTKNITVERGLIAGELDVNHFLRKPLKEIKEGKLEFKVRLCSHDTDFEKVLQKANFDDIFIISDKEFDFLKTLSDTNIERIETTEVNEIKYLLSLNNKM
jgi:anti-anti-sigma regulatory factor